MNKSRKNYEKSFKKNAVKLSYERKNISSLAQELGISSATLHPWRKEFNEYGKKSFPGNGKPKLTAEQERIRELEKELKDAQLEAEILKKAIGIFSKSGRTSTSS